MDTHLREVRQATAEASCKDCDLCLFSLHVSHLASASELQFPVSRILTPQTSFLFAHGIPSTEEEEMQSGKRGGRDKEKRSGAKGQRWRCRHEVHGCPPRHSGGLAHLEGRIPCRCLRIRGRLLAASRLLHVLVHAEVAAPKLTGKLRAGNGDFAICWVHMCVFVSVR